jgi:hypothetical protein
MGTRGDFTHELERVRMYTTSTTIEGVVTDVLNNPDMSRAQKEAFLAHVVLHVGPDKFSEIVLANIRTRKPCTDAVELRALMSLGMALKSQCLLERN